MLTALVDGRTISGPSLCLGVCGAGPWSWRRWPEDQSRRSLARRAHPRGQDGEWGGWRASPRERVSSGTATGLDFLSSDVHQAGIFPALKASCVPLPPASSPLPADQPPEPSPRSGPSLRRPYCPAQPDFLLKEPLPHLSLPKPLPWTRHRECPLHVCPLSTFTALGLYRA